MYYKIVVEDDGHEIIPSRSLQLAYGFLTGQSYDSAERKIVAIKNDLKKFALENKMGREDFWFVPNRLVSLRREGKTRTYSIAPEQTYELQEPED